MPHVESRCSSTFFPLAIRCFRRFIALLRPHLALDLAARCWPLAKPWYPPYLWGHHGCRGKSDLSSACVLSSAPLASLRTAPCGVPLPLTARAARTETGGGDYSSEARCEQPSGEAASDCRRHDPTAEPVVTVAGRRVTQRPCAPYGDSWKSTNLQIYKGHSGERPNGELRGTFPGRGAAPRLSFGCAPDRHVV